jgi:hypothetical protein
MLTRGKDGAFIGLCYNPDGENLMLAFHNDPALKAFVLDELAAHRAADRLVKGQYWKNGKGCAVSCTLQAVSQRASEVEFLRPDFSSHIDYETHLGIPRIIARLEDRFFEALPNGESQAWPERFTSAIRTSADLTMVWPCFAFWLLTEEVPQHTKNERCRASLAEVGALYRSWIDGRKPTMDRWLGARNTSYAAFATAAAASAAISAADAAAATFPAAAAAPTFVTDAAVFVTDVAAFVTDAYPRWRPRAARIASYRRQSDYLIKLLEQA